MIIIVGLGNPGKSYQNHRHNIGFSFLEYLRQAHNAPNFKASNFKASNFKVKGGAMISNFHDKNQKIILLLPMGYMNNSGFTLQAALNYFDIDSSDVLVVHDELDLPFGRLRVKFDGGAGGHNGLRSIDQHIGKAYWRLRFGIGHPGHKDMVSDYVLHDFNKTERAAIPNIFAFLTKGLDDFIKGDTEKFIQQINGYPSTPNTL